MFGTCHLPHFLHSSTIPVALCPVPKKKQCNLNIQQELNLWLPRETHSARLEPYTMYKITTRGMRFLVKGKRISHRHNFLQVTKM